jgi:hypothetical protein
MNATDLIPKERYEMWLLLFLSSSNGRFNQTPQHVNNNVLVDYSFDDMDACNNFHADYRQLATPIVEINFKPSIWLRIKSKLLG